MSFLGFGTNYNKPGPGIPKDAKQKTGSALFFEILGREFWSLWTLSFIYILACIPIVTIGPATAALCRVTVNMVRDQTVYVWRDFWEAFRKNIKQGIIFGIPTTMFIVAALMIDIPLIFSIAAGTATIWQMVFLFLWNFLGISAGCYIFPMIANISLASMPLLKNSLLLVVLGKWRTLAATLVSIALATAAILFFPLSLMFLLFAGYFSFLSFFTSFMVWPVIDKYVVHGDELRQEPETLPQEDPEE